MLIVRVRSWPRRFRNAVSLPVFGVLLASAAARDARLDPLPRQQPLTVDPQQAAELMGVAAVGFLLRPFLGLDQHRLSAAVLGQHFQQPVVEAADFDDRYESAFRFGESPQFLEKRPHTLPFRANLPSQDDVPRFIANTHGQLLAVLVDSKV